MEEEPPGAAGEEKNPQKRQERELREAGLGQVLGEDPRN